MLLISSIVINTCFALEHNQCTKQGFAINLPAIALYPGTYSSTAQYVVNPKNGYISRRRTSYQPIAIWCTAGQPLCAAALHYSEPVLDDDKFRDSFYSAIDKLLASNSGKVFAVLQEITGEGLVSGKTIYSWGIDLGDANRILSGIFCQDTTNTEGSSGSILPVLYINKDGNLVRSIYVDSLRDLLITTTYKIPTISDRYGNPIGLAINTFYGPAVTSKCSIFLFVDNLLMSSLVNELAECMR